MVAQPANLHTPADLRFEYSLVIWDLKKFAAYRYMSGLYASSDVCALAHAMLRLGALAEKHLPPILCILIRTDWQHDVFKRERLLPILMRRYEASSSAGLALRLAFIMADCADSKDEFLELYKANTDDFRTWANRKENTERILTVFESLLRDGIYSDDGPEYFVEEVKEVMPAGSKLRKGLVKLAKAEWPEESND